MKNIRPFLKTASYGMLILFVNQILFPMYSFAITGHSSMPEYKSFEPVATTNMVNEFDGSFTYNLPLMNVPNGYPINLAYHSKSVNNEALSSWVGLGWNINPGVINRNKKGFPDEYNGQTITYHNRMPANWTIAATFGANIDLFAKEGVSKRGSTGETYNTTSGGLISVNLSQTTSFNNYTGLGTSMNFGVSDFAGVANFNASFANGKYNGATYSINPLNVLNAMGADKPIEEKDGERVESEENDANDEFNLKNNNFKEDREKGLSVVLSSYNPSFGPAFRPIPVSVSESFGVMASLKFDVAATIIPLSIKGQGSIKGSFTHQKNRDEEEKRSVYGYLNTDVAYLDEHGMMDFTMEMESMLEKNDEISGYPIANPDNYNLSGEAFGGSFEAVRSDFGYFRPDKKRSEDIGIDLGASVTFPLLQLMPWIANFEFGIGGSAAGNYHQTDITAWEDFMDDDLDDRHFSFRQASSFSRSQEKYFYLFNGDQAGYFDITENISGGSPVFDDFPFVPLLTGVDGLDTHYQGLRLVDFRSEAKQKKRSTHIVTHTNSDFYDGGKIEGKCNTYYRTYEKALEIKTGGTGGIYTDYSYSGYPKKAIAEIVATNKDGLTYVYGLPVYARNEKSIQYSFENGEGLSFPADDAFAAEGVVAQVGAGFLDVNASRKLGQWDANMYPTTYLLTQILSADYIDRTGNGPSEDDFGAYTHLKYEKIHGGTAWYGHRSPFKGVSFNVGSLSSKKDDMGSFSYGEKEVYLLDELHSKTHVAEFTNGNRDDGFSVGLNNVGELNGPTDEEIAKWSGSSSIKRLKKLEKIELFSKKADGTPNNLNSTVHFVYDYSLSPKLPNNINSLEGKLTLKKVWVEHGGVSKNRIQPYEFDYQYPNKSDYPVSAHYSDVGGLEINEYDNATIPTSIQNPDYKSFNTDPWGQYCNYEKDQLALNAGTKNLKRFFPFVNQNPVNTLFDPAAYYLKQIKLPSGGEIHVQYEQHDYAHVQNKNAMVMVPLLNGYKNTDPKETNNKLYFLDLSKIGISIPTSYADKVSLASKLFKTMSKDRMYFKFLYALKGGTADYTKGHSEFIEGFSVISSYGFQDGDFFFSFDDETPSTADWYVTIPNIGKTSKREIPRKVCKDFYKSQRRMLIDGGNNAVGLSQAVKDGDKEALAKTFLGILEEAGRKSVNRCKFMDPDMSFVRLNMPLGDIGKLGKKAGGARVKRLLMYEDGAMLGDLQSVYGTEYIYTTHVDGIIGLVSSGVATNESGTIKMENPFVLPIDKSEISIGEAILGASYLYKHMGPIGFGFMPSPSIGYSKVTSRSIHPGVTGTGSTIKEFHTAFEHPCFMQDQSTDAPVPRYGRSPQWSSSFGLAGFSVTNEQYSSTQGVVVHLNDMHGKPKSETILSQDGASTVSSTTYQYMFYENKNDDQNQVVRLMTDNMEIRDARLGELGRKVSQHGYSKSIIDENVSVRATFDGDGPGGVAYPGFPIPIPGILAKLANLALPVGASYSRIRYNTASVSKVVQHTSIQTAVITQNEGITTTTINHVFDDHTGDPVIKSYKDDFQNGTYVEQIFKGSWNYSGMQSKYQNEGLIITPATYDLFAITGLTVNGVSSITFKPNDPNNLDCDLMKSFQVGDFIEIENASTFKGKLFHITEVDPTSLSLIVEKSMHHVSTTGLPTSINSIVILKSGYTNQLNTTMGNTVYFTELDVSSLFPSNTSGITNGSNRFIADLNDAIPTSNFTITLENDDFYPGVDLSFYGITCGNDNLGTINNVVIDVTVSTALNEPTKINYSMHSFMWICGTGTPDTLKNCVQ